MDSGLLAALGPGMTGWFIRNSCHVKPPRGGIANAPPPVLFEGRRDRPHSLALARARGGGAPRGVQPNNPRLARHGAPNDAGRPPLGAPPRHLQRSRLRISSGPGFRETGIGAGPVQQAPCRAVVMPPGRGPGAARVRGYEPRPQGPHPAPPTERLRTTPLGEQGGRRI
jgi:hypothetical protein